MIREKKEKMGVHRLICGVLAGGMALTLFLSGCTADTGIFMGELKDTSGEHAGLSAAEREDGTEREDYTTPPDGNPEDITCRGSYTREYDPGTVVAQAGEETLTNGELNVFYRLTVNGYTPGEGETGPDFSVPLDSQLVPGKILTWQQYFLMQALESWHACQALQQKSLEYVERDEPYFEPSPKLHEEYMKDMPINDILYTKDGSYRISKMHQEYLDGLPRLLEEKAEQLAYENAAAMLKAEFGAHADVETAVSALELANRAYMYFTEFTYEIEPDEKTIQQASTPMNQGTVDIRHVLLVPENAQTDENGRILQASEDAWSTAQAKGMNLWQTWQKDWRRGDASFANLAHDNSDDAVSAINGGLYANVEKGQLPAELDAWCFDPAREEKEIELIKSDFGYHLVYLQKIRDEGRSGAEAQYRRNLEAALVQEAMDTYPMDVDYSQIALDPCEGQGKLTLAADLLYPDVGYERISEIPVYVQQDFRNAPYGGYRVGSHGCGITTLAMVSSYMSDSYLTPADLAARYGSFNGLHGTDGMIFNKMPPEMDYYMHKKTYDWEEAKDALREGREVVSVQHKGYFTRAGHYLSITGINDQDKTVVIRDSNIYNYGRLPEHKVDAFPAYLVPQAGHGYWIFDYKLVTIPYCSRCGDPEGPGTPAYFSGDYICPKCRAAMERRDNFLALSGLN